eukprot:964264_1
MDEYKWDDDEKTQYIDDLFDPFDPILTPQYMGLIAEKVIIEQRISELVRQYPHLDPYAQQIRLAGNEPALLEPSCCAEHGDSSETISKEEFEKQKAQIQEKDQQLKKMDKDNSDLQAQVKQLTGVQSLSGSEQAEKLKNLTNQNAVLTARIAEMEQAHNLPSSAGAAGETQGPDNESLITELREANARISDLADRLGAAPGDTVTLQELASTVQREKEEAERRATSLGQEKSELETTNSTKEAKISQLKTDLASRTSERDDLRKSVGADKESLVTELQEA